MADLGDLGVAQEEVEPLTFGWFGHVIHVPDSMSELALVDFMDTYGDLDESDPQTVLVLKQLMHEFVADGDFDTFWKAARENRQGVKELVGVIQTVIEAVVARPTGQSSDSGGGLESTSPNSADGSQVEGLAARRYPDRPDMQLQVVRSALANAG